MDVPVSTALLSASVRFFIVRPPEAPDVQLVQLVTLVLTALSLLPRTTTNTAEREREIGGWGSQPFNSRESSRTKC